MKLNMGCGRFQLDGWVNVDVVADCEPDILFDLESRPWPWPDDSAEQVLFSHSLEHMGREPRVFLGIMQELYRVCCNRAQIQINVPHPRHDSFIDDPTHVPAITPGTLHLMDREICDGLARGGSANTPFAHYLRVDFSMIVDNRLLAEPYASQRVSNTISDDDVAQLSLQFNNVVREYQFVLVARKPYLG